MSLAQKLARLEVLVKAQSDESAVPAYWTPERVAGWQQWAQRLLLTMSHERAVRVFAEMTTTPADQWGTVVRRVDRMARLGADGIYEAVEWPYWADRAVALPDAVCELLERHPDARYTVDYSCERCGLETPHLPYAGPSLLSICPLCSGTVERNGYTVRRNREDSVRVGQGMTGHRGRVA